MSLLRGRSSLPGLPNEEERDKYMSLLEVRAISKAFGGIQALSSCSIAVEQGSITGLIGPNGSGKTTLFNVITAYERADKGSIHFKGKDITRETPKGVFRLGIGRTFQHAVRWAGESWRSGVVHKHVRRAHPRTTITRHV